MESSNLSLSIVRVIMTLWILKQCSFLDLQNKTSFFAWFNVLSGYVLLCINIFFRILDTAQSFHQGFRNTTTKKSCQNNTLLVENRDQGAEAEEAQNCLGKVLVCSSYQLALSIFFRHRMLNRNRTLWKSMFFSAVLLLLHIHI